MSGFFSPAAAKMSITSSEATALETSWRMAWSSSSGGLRPSGAHFAMAAAHGLEEADSSRIASASSCGTARANACGQLGDGHAAAALARRSVGLRTCSCAGGSSASRCAGVAGEQGRLVEAVEHVAADLVLLQQHGDGLGLVDRRLARAAALGVRRAAPASARRPARGSRRPGRRACRGTRGSRGRSPASGRAPASACRRTSCAGRGRRSRSATCRGRSPA